MAITKQNTYEVGVNNDLTNLSVNVDRNRLGEDKVIIENDGANLLIKVGSLIEANGSLYAVDTSDISLTRTDGYLVFDDVGLAFSIVNSETAELDPTRAGFYRPAPNDTQRVTRWDISGTELTINIDRQLLNDKTFTELNAVDSNISNDLTVGNDLTVENEAYIENNIIVKNSILPREDAQTEGSWVIASGGTQLIPRGVYSIILRSGSTAYSEVEYYNGSNWRLYSTGDTNSSRGVYGCCVFSDGVNARVVSNGSTTTTYYHKF